MTGNFMGRKQYTKLVKVLYCKLPTTGIKELPSFPQRVKEFELPTSEVGGECVITASPWPLISYGPSSSFLGESAISLTICQTIYPTYEKIK